MSSERLAGHFSVDDSARRIRQYRYAEERMLRALGGWIALTPELPAKLLFGRHVWDCAQHADLWGKRLPELRAPAQQSEPANDRVVKFADLLESAEGPRETVERVAGVYRVLKPHLITVYARHLAHANPIYEPPTRRILERCIDEERRHAAAGAVVLARLTRDDETRERAKAWEHRLLALLGEAGGVTGDVAAPLIDAAVLAESPPAVKQDLVDVPPEFDPAVLEPDLAAAVDAYRHALASGDAARALAVVEPAARAAVTAEHDRLGDQVTASRVVALASIGHHRLVKVRLEGARVVGHMQLRWTPSAAGWRLSAADLVRVEPIDVGPVL
ncbi:MAG TPA: hypothetical protein VFQ62_15060 [Methylomirabilota bacterium]|nr:hypothetical protein [Methylomirabilota bacterium]